jgi:hypothetical protein
VFSTLIVEPLGSPLRFIAAVLVPDAVISALTVMSIVIGVDGTYPNSVNRFQSTVGLEIVIASVDGFEVGGGPRKGGSIS